MPNNEILMEPQTQEERLAFAKACFDYCVTIYETEDQRKQNLEDKARFYLSFITLFLGAIFFNIEFLEKLRVLVKGKTVPVSIANGIYICVVALSISLLLSLISVLISTQLRSYKGVYPKDVTQMLFGPNSVYLEKRSLMDLYKTIAMSYTIALEHNEKINERKANWTKVAAFGIVVTVISLSILLALFTYSLML